MVFEFKAHKPNAYRRFALLLICLVLLNILLIRLLHTVLLDWNNWILSSIIFIIPWILILFLPSILGGVVIYNSLTNKYRIVIQPSHLRIESVKTDGTNRGIMNEYQWSELKEFHFTDFEDNKYFQLIFNNPKNDLVIHRDSGDFETFFEELKKYLK